MAEKTTTNDHPAATKHTERCLVVFGTKGGVGKTVVTVNLGVCLAIGTKKPVCLVDLDTMATGDLARMLGLGVQHAVTELAPQYKKAKPPETFPLEGLVVQHVSGVHVVQAMMNPRHGNLLEPHLLKALFTTLKAKYEYVLVDAGKGLTDPLIAAFDEANLILLVATPDVVTLYQTKWAMNIIESLLFPPHMVKAVLNRADSRGGVGSQDVRMAVPCEVIGEIPSDGRAMGTAVNQGQPVVTTYGYAKVTEGFRKLAEVLVTRPELFLAHHEIPRHQRAPGDDGNMASSGFVSGSSKFYAPVEVAAAQEDGDEIVALKRRVHERLVTELDLKKVDVAAINNAAYMQEMRERCQRVIANLLSRELGGIVSSHEVRSKLINEIIDEALGLGPLEELLADDSITDILVNSKDQIYIERKGKLELTNKKFISEDQVRAAIERIVTPLGRRIDESNPMVDARLPDGSRVNAIIPPLAVKGPALSIRKFGHIHLQQQDLIGYGSLTIEMVQFIRACVLVRKNMIVSGGTGSGKTTMLNLLSGFIPDTERIVTIEDAAELRLVQDHWVSLEARPANVEGKGDVTIRDLFRNALRMRPDRIIIGECRGAESLDMLQAMNTGHDGSFTSIHANSPRDVVSRLDSMVLMSDIELPIRAIREMVASAIHVIVHTARLSDGTRKMTAITELMGLSAEGEIQLQDLLVFKQSGVDENGGVQGGFHSTGRVPTFLEDLKVKGIRLDERMFKAGPLTAPNPSSGSAAR